MEPTTATTILAADAMPVEKQHGNTASRLRQLERIVSGVTAPAEISLARTTWQALSLRTELRADTPAVCISAAAMSAALPRLRREHDDARIRTPLGMVFERATQTAAAAPHVGKRIAFTRRNGGRNDVSPSYEPDRVTFSRKSQLGMLFIAGCSFAVGLLLLYGRGL
jgi:hypothetical protein